MMFNESLWMESLLAWVPRKSFYCLLICHSKSIFVLINFCHVEMPAVIVFQKDFTWLLTEDIYSSHVANIDLIILKKRWNAKNLAYKIKFRTKIWCGNEVKQEKFSSSIYLNKIYRSHTYMTNNIKVLYICAALNANDSDVGQSWMNKLNIMFWMVPHTSFWKSFQRE